MSEIYHVDGDLVDRSEATVHVDDRGFRYGDGAFETCRAYGGTVFLWDRHLDRLETTCGTLGMPAVVPDDLAGRVRETLAANDLNEAYVRISVTRGVQPGTLSPAEVVDPTVVIYVKPLSRGGLDSVPVWDGPAAVDSAETRRISEQALPVDVKTHNYLNGILARLELRNNDSDTDEALMLDCDGNVAEGTTSNVFFVEDGILKTPHEGTILPGITRAVVIELAESMNIPVETGRYDLSRLYGTEEAFLTNTTWEIRPIGTLDGTSIGAGPITDQLREAYDERVEKRCYQPVNDDQNL